MEYKLLNMKKLFILITLCYFSVTQAQFFNTANGELAYKLYTTSGAFTTNVVYLVFNERITKEQADLFEKEYKKLNETQKHKVAQELAIKGFRIETETLEGFYSTEPTFSTATQAWEGKLKPLNPVKGKTILDEPDTTLTPKYQRR